MIKFIKKIWRRGDRVEADDINRWETGIADVHEGLDSLARNPFFTHQVTAPAFAGDLIGNADTATRTLVTTIPANTDLNDYILNGDYQGQNLLTNVNRPPGATSNIFNLTVKQRQWIAHSGLQVLTLNTMQQWIRNFNRTPDGLSFTNWIEVPSQIGNTMFNMRVTRANQLHIPRLINGTTFDGSASITTARWGTARIITIGEATWSVDGSSDLTWSLSDLGIRGGPTGDGGEGEGRIDIGRNIMIQTGRISIAGGSGSIAQLAVSFPLSYSITPNIQISTTSAVPGTEVLGISASSPTPDGFNARVLRTNAITTPIHWTAIGFSDRI